VEYNLARLRMLGFARTLRRLRDAEGGDDASDEALTLELSDSYFAHRDRDPALFPDTVPCLDALPSRYRLGLLSNGSRLPQKVGLDGYFESVVFAQDHRVAKPDKGIFEIVEGQQGVRPAGACWWATTRSTTWRRSSPVGRRCGSTGMLAACSIRSSGPAR
jgi:FMN phosphatase YigB (HAD superfamily)